MRRMLGLVAALSFLTVVAGCGSDTDPSPDTAPEPFSLPVGNPSYEADAATWALGTRIRVGDVEIAAKPAPDAYVVTRSGAYYLSDRTLHFTDGSRTDQVARVDSDAIVTSPDGRYLGLIDAAHGPVDEYDTHVAVPVVFDLETGEQVLRGEPGRSLEDDDLADLYEEIPPVVLGFDEQAVYAVDPLQPGDADVHRFPLDGAPPEPVVDPPDFTDERGIEGTAEELPGGRFRWSTDESAALYAAVLAPTEDVLFVDDGRGMYFDADSGEATVFSETPFTLGGWLDDDTFYGAFSARGSSEGPSGPTTIASCEVAARPTCTPVAPELDLPDRPPLLFGTGKQPVVH